MTTSRIKTLVFGCLAAVTLSACTQEGEAFTDTSNKQTYSYSQPEFKNDGWLTGHVADFAIDEAAVTQLVQDINAGIHPGIDSISIVKDQTLLLHENFRNNLNHFDEIVGNHSLERHVMHSTSKSFASSLIGIAIDKGYIQDESIAFYSLLDYSQFENWSTHKADMQLQDVLTMQLGFYWDEWTYPFGDSDNSLTHLTSKNADFVKALLDQPLLDPPGERFAYNSVASIALAQVLESSTGIALEDFAQVYLFDPLQINSADWMMTPMGFPDTSSGLSLDTRDMAKFGQLYLNNGQWNGVQVVSEAWIAKSLQPHVALVGEFTTGYGFQWWLGEFEHNNQTIPFYSTRGYGGQFIVVVPEQSLVVAFTAQNYENGLYLSPLQIIQEQILPAIVE